MGNIVKGNIVGGNVVRGNVVGMVSKKNPSATETKIYCVSNGDKYLGSDCMYYKCK